MPHSLKLREGGKLIRGGGELSPAACKLLRPAKAPKAHKALHALELACDDERACEQMSAQHLLVCSVKTCFEVLVL